MKQPKHDGEKNIHVLLNGQMYAMVQRMKNEGGYFTDTEVIREAIRRLYEKQFPGYMDK